MYVAVVGPGDSATDRDRRLARAVGTLVARRGGVVLTGGLGGVMAAAAEGAAQAGGVSIGLLPGLERAEASPALTHALPTGLGEMRNALLVRCADGVLGVGGSWGTLSEVALARRTGVPLVLLGGWSVTDEAGAPCLAERAETPEQAVDELVRRLSGR